jgi:uncharacterized RDD family membrane protein YckC
MTYPPPQPGNQYPPPYQPYPAQPGYSPPAVEYANWGQRVGAYLIDALCAGAPAAIGAAFGIHRTVVDGLPQLSIGAVYYVFALIGLGVQIYNRWVLAGRTGQSWGRKALGIRLVGQATGQPIGAGMAFVRDLAHVLDALPCYIGFLFPIWDQQRQTFADKVVKTLVVR